MRAVVAGLVPRPCPTGSLRVARRCGRSRASTVPYRVLARRAPLRQVSYLDRALQGLRVARAVVAGLVPRPCPTGSLRGVRRCGRSRTSTVPYKVFARCTPSWQVSCLDRALQGPCAARAVVAGLVPRPCPTRPSRDVRRRGRSRTSTVPYKAFARCAALWQVSGLGSVVSEAPRGDRFFSPTA